MPFRSTKNAEADLKHQKKYRLYNNYLATVCNCRLYCAFLFLLLLYFQKNKKKEQLIKLLRLKPIEFESRVLLLIYKQE